MTGEVMTSGEELHAANRKRFWRTLSLAGVGGIPVGFAVGLGFGLSRGDINAFWTGAPAWLVIALVTLSAAGFLWGSWRFYRSIDEVERLDNLWSSSAAYAAYAIIFPCWWALGQAEIAPVPNDWMIYLIALLIGLLAYGKRKWDAR
jgi:hypothetical protein